jgi:hypothetical protein
MSSTTEKNRIRNKISRLADELNASSGDEDEALSIFDSVCQAGPQVVEEYGDPEIATACIRLAIETRGASLPVNFLCKTSQSDPDPNETARAEYEIATATNNDAELSGPLHILHKNSNVLPDSTQKTAESLLTSVPEGSMTSVTSKATAAGAAYAAALIEGDKSTTQKLLSKTFNVSDVTIRKRYEELIANSERYTEKDKTIQPAEMSGSSSGNRKEAIQRLADKLGWTEGEEYTSTPSGTSIRNAGLESLTGTEMTVRQATRLAQEYDLSEDDFRLSISLKAPAVFKLLDEVSE